MFLTRPALKRNYLITSYHHIAKGSFTIVHFIILSSRLCQALHTKETEFQETEKASESDTDMKGMLRLSDKQFKITIMNTARAVMEKLDKMEKNRWVM